MNTLIVLVRLVAVYVAYLVFAWLFPFDRLSRRLGYDGAFVFGIFFCSFAAILTIEAFDYLPVVGARISSVSFPRLLGRTDVGAPLQSLFGFLLSDGVIVLITTALYLLTFTFLFSVREGSDGRRLLFIIVGYVAVRYVYNRSLRGAGLPETNAGFAAFYQAVGAERLEAAALQTAVAFLLLAALALLLHLSWTVARMGPGRYPLRYFSHQSIDLRQMFLMALYAAVVFGGFILAGRLSQYWLPGAAADGAPTLRALTLKQGGLLLAAVLATFIFRAVNVVDEVMRWLKPRWESIADALLGLLWSFLLVCAVVLVERQYGWTEAQGMRELWAAARYEYLALFMLAAVTSALVFQGCLLVALNDCFPFGVSAVLTAAAYALFHLGLSGAALSALPTVFFAGLLHCYLFKMSRSLWLPALFNMGWNFWLATLTGSPSSALTFGVFGLGGEAHGLAAVEFGIKEVVLIAAALVVSLMTANAAIDVGEKSPA